MSKANTDWPMANYMSAWKTFRRLGDEPAATARHVTQQSHWPDAGPVAILDLGCGDGRMLEAFFKSAPRGVRKAVLLDPDEGLLVEAAGVLDDLGMGAKIDSVQGLADIEGLACSTSVDVGLAIHVVYLMPHARFREVVERWPAGVPLYVVLDAPSSVFNELWTLTAPDFAQRSKSAREYLSNRGGEHVEVVESEFETTVANPFNLAQPERDLVLSLLCYCDFPALPAAVRAQVEAIVARYASNGFLRCACRCYEILRHDRPGQQALTTSPK